MSNYFRTIYILLFVQLIIYDLAFAKSKTDTYKFHTPAEFIEMMEKGHVTYAIETKENLEPTNLTITNSEIRLVNPYSKITQDNNNTKLITEEPTGEIKKLYELAAQKLKRKNYEEVLRLYEHA